MELINNVAINRRDMMLKCGTWNLPARINDLRKKGVDIETKFYECRNIYGRVVKYSSYLISDKSPESLDNLRSIYFSLVDGR